ncbi:hypothetical protein ACFFGH_24785 [Lysobacter korlensis]|uniref:Uncharacterized protein n=1 Tax=Lysobacter korlensis TaxID=553636 RepID=A0ABV6RX70_9GAMM
MKPGTKRAMPHYLGPMRLPASLACAAAVLLAGGCAVPDGDGPVSEVLLLRADSPASAGSDAAALPARVQVIADRCVGAVAGGRAYLIRFPSDTAWDGETVRIPNSPAVRVGDDVTFGGSGSAIDVNGADRDVPAGCAAAADEIWYVGAVTFG